MRCRWRGLACGVLGGCSWRGLADGMLGGAVGRVGGRSGGAVGGVGGRSGGAVGGVGGRSGVLAGAVGRVGVRGFGGCVGGRRTARENRIGDSPRLGSAGEPELLRFLSEGWTRIVEVRRRPEFSARIHAVTAARRRVVMRRTASNPGSLTSGRLGSAGDSELLRFMSEGWTRIAEVRRRPEFSAGSTPVTAARPPTGGPLAAGGPAGRAARGARPRAVSRCARAAERGSRLPSRSRWSSLPLQASGARARSRWLGPHRRASAISLARSTPARKRDLVGSVHTGARARRHARGAPGRHRCRHIPDKPLTFSTCVLD